MIAADVLSISASLGALLIAATGAAFSAVTIRRRATTDYTDELEGHIDLQEKEIQKLKQDLARHEIALEDCRAIRDSMEQKYWKLLAEMYELQKKVGGG